MSSQIDWRTSLCRGRAMYGSIHILLVYLIHVYSLTSFSFIHYILCAGQILSLLIILIAYVVLTLYLLNHTGYDPASCISSGAHLFSQTQVDSRKCPSGADVSHIAPRVSKSPRLCVQCVNSVQSWQYWEVPTATYLLIRNKKLPNPNLLFLKIIMKHLIVRMLVHVMVR